MSTLTAYLILAAKDQMSRVVASASNSSLNSLQNFSSKANKLSNNSFNIAAKDQMSRVVASASNSSLNSLQNFSSKANKLSNNSFNIAAKSALVSASILGPLGLTIKAAEDSEKANKRLVNVFRTMGEVNDKAAVQSAKYADELQHKIGIEDEEIMMVQAKIATFKKASDEAARMSGMFNRATVAAFDMAAGGFGEAAQNAVQLGKALQNPALGAQALAKAGAIAREDMPMIKHLQATKGVAAAQEFVMKQIERQFKGQAANTATASDRMRIKFAAVSETLGNRLLPTFIKAQEYLIKLIDRFNEWSARNPKLLETILQIAAGIGVAAAAISGLTFTFGVITKGVYLFNGALTFLAANPIVAIIIGIATAIYFFYTRFKIAFDQIRIGWPAIKQAFSDGINYILNLPLLKPVKLIIENWDKIKIFFSGLWDFVKTKFNDFIDFVKSIPQIMYDAGANIVKSIWEGIKSMASKPVEAIKNIVSKIRDYLPFSPAKTGPLRDIHRIRLIETIAESIKPNALTRAMRVTTAAALVAATPMIGSSNGSPNALNSKGGITIEYKPVIYLNGASPNAMEDFKKQLKNNSLEIVKIVEETMRKENRKKL